MKFLYFFAALMITAVLITLSVAFATHDASATALSYFATIVLLMILYLLFEDLKREISELKAIINAKAS
jgi:hypothetical protein